MLSFVSFYLLFTQTEREIAAYIGSTKDPYRRMSEHLVNSQEPIIPRYSSSDLARLANKRKLPIRVLFLEVGLFDQLTRVPVEGAWVAAAKRSGFKLPGVGRWGNINPKRETRSMSLVLEGIGNAPRLRDLFVNVEEGDCQPSAFQRAMQFAKDTSDADAI